MVSGCEADPDRPRYRDPGWQCDGTGLVTVLRGPKNIPVVVQTHLMPEVLSRPDAGMFRPEPFGGGDHYHLCV